MGAIDLFALMSCGLAGEIRRRKDYAIVAYATAAFCCKYADVLRYARVITELYYRAISTELPCNRTLST